MGNFSSFRERLKDALSRIRAGNRKAEEEQREEAPPIRLSDEAMAFMRSFTEDNPERGAASEGSKKAARRIFSIFHEYAGDDAVITTLRIAPHIYKEMAVVAAVSASAVSILCIIGVPFAALIVSVFYIVQLINGLRKKPNRFAKFFVTSEAYNVHAVIEPEGEVKNTVIFTSHHDSAEIREKGTGARGFISSAIPLAISYAALTSVALCSVVVNLFQGRLFGLPSLPVMILAIVLLIPSAAVIFYCRSFSGRFSPGAGDNASGLSIVTTLLHFYSRKSDEGSRLSSTRLVFASFDGEECGTAGSSGWFRSHRHLFSENTYVINFDGIYREEDLVFLAKDGNGLIPLSFSLASRCSRIASAMGYHIGVGKIGFLGGETDAVSAAVLGLNAVTVTSMAPGTENPSHSLDDTPDKVSEEAVSESISVAVKLVSEMEDEERKSPQMNYLDGTKHYRISKY